MLNTQCGKDHAMMVAIFRVNTKILTINRTTVQLWGYFQNEHDEYHAVVWTVQQGRQQKLGKFLARFSAWRIVFFTV
jgi:hypothetical protein